MNATKLALIFSLLLGARAALPAVEPAAAQRGTASWYGRECSSTASGERYDPNSLTAAHRTLPFGTLVRVTNLTSKRSTVVRINNRGPFTKGRIIDVSQAAARELQMIRSGTARVAIEVIPSE
jgi:rare lipoprotein A